MRSRVSSLPGVIAWVGCCGLFVLAVRLPAQDPRGSLFGKVLDPTGGRVAGAQVTLQQPESSLERRATSNRDGEFEIHGLDAGKYRLEVSAAGFAETREEVRVAVSSSPTVSVMLAPQSLTQAVEVRDMGPTLASQPIETTSSVEKTTISQSDLGEFPLANRSFANIAYLAPMTEPVEPSDPTKARITAVSFAGSSGLNVDLSVDGGDNNDDYIGGFLQNFSPEAVQEFVVRTAQFDADTSRTNGGSVILNTRRGTNEWHGGVYFYRGQVFNARNPLDNPEPNPKQPFSRQNIVAALGGPIRSGKLWFFSSFEYVDENASVAYSGNSLNEFNALAQLAADGLIPGVSSIPVPTSVLVPFRDALLLGRVDWARSARTEWFFRASLDRNNTQDDLVQQGTLPSTGALTHSNYFNALVHEQSQFSGNWLGSLTLDASIFHHTKDRNSHLGLALAFPFSASFHATSGFETFGDNQFIAPITAFPIRRDQQKYQLRYDVTHATRAHAVKFGVNVIHEPVLDGQLANNLETLVVFPNDPSFYLLRHSQFRTDFVSGSSPSGCPSPTLTTFCLGGNGSFTQSIRRLGFYAQNSWRVLPSLTLNYGLRYDTTFGLFRAEQHDQNLNPAFVTLRHLGIDLVPGIPHDYRGAVAPRLGLAYAPGRSPRTVLRAGFGLYYNDLAQNGWVNAFQGVSTLPAPLLGRGQQGALIDPHYKTPYALQASFGVEHSFGNAWRLNVQYEHQQGVHQYRRYEYIGGITLISPITPGQEPNLSLFRTDNRSRYDGVAFQVQHRFSQHFELTANYVLASASTWGATVGELFDYVNGVTDVRHPFGPGDHGPSGEDVRHRLVIAGVVILPWQFEVSTLAQFEGARPFTMTTRADLNNDGLSNNDRAVVNGVQTSLDEFRGTPFAQIDLRVSRQFLFQERLSIRPFAEFFNLMNRRNPGNNFVTDISALPTRVNNLSDATAFCLNSSCTQTRPIRSINDLQVPAGAFGDSFGPGTTVGIPFAAQLGIRLTF